MRPERAAFGAFLRSRRDRLAPSQAGITAFPGARRVPGLRKEELALLAGVSVDYYSRLEQGRQLNVSDEVLDALARALRLDDIETAHLRDLAAPAAGRRVVPPDSPQHADPGLLRIMTALDHLPVLLLGQRTEILAHNALLGVVLGRSFEPGSSFIRYLLQDSLARERITNWSNFASSALAAIRREVARRPNDLRFQLLIRELTKADADVARWWQDHAVHDYASIRIRIDHPDAGPLNFEIEILNSPLEPDQHLVVYTAQPDSPTSRVLPTLAS
jgi:transcriptional regulator with XRE-family HTH domain